MVAINGVSAVFIDNRGGVIRGLADDNGSPTFVYGRSAAELFLPVTPVLAKYYQFFEHTQSIWKRPPAVMKARVRDVLHGGNGDGRSLSDFDHEEVRMGMDEEREHTPDEQIRSEIVRDHLVEDPRYYSKLKKLV